MCADMTRDDEEKCNYCHWHCIKWANKFVAILSLQDVRGMLSENKLPNNVFWDRLTKPDDLMPACHAEQTFVENNKNLDHEALVLSARQLKSHKDILHVSDFSNIRQKCSNSSVCVNCNNCWSHILSYYAGCLLSSLVPEQCWVLSANVQEIPFSDLKNMIHLSLTCVAMWSKTFPLPKWRFLAIHSSLLSWCNQANEKPWEANEKTHSALVYFSHHLGAIFALPPFKFVFINYYASSGPE